jgi:uncharacterized protein YlxP (DUF503 family)
MHVGLLVVDCFVPGSQSLKDKRSVIQGTLERLKRRHNISACEVEFQNQWQRARLAIVLVNTEWRMIQRGMSHILEYLEKDHRLDVLDSEATQLY